ncbi:MAG: hypothetical protein RKP20_15715 [Candidatus Competibacter sp.]|nr:hypothetical protein [Candidatus Competibacter sp.]MDS4042608.1 hypothetical protein [Candidatus Competibacter sp.]
MDRPTAFEFSGTTSTERGETILGAVASGQLSVADGARLIECLQSLTSKTYTRPMSPSELIECLQSLTRLAEFDEIERRSRALEDRP